MAQLNGVFSKTRAACGAPVYVTELSTWEANGFPDPVSGMPLDPVVVQLEERPLNGEVAYWVGKSYLSGAFIRVYND